jgi:hypothetical protein
LKSHTTAVSHVVLPLAPTIMRPVSVSIAFTERLSAPTGEIERKLA